LVEQVLLALKVAFVVVLYLFVWRVIRVASRDLNVGQESMILAPVRSERQQRRRPARLVVVTSPQLAEGSELPLVHQLLAGRADGSDIALGTDGYASGHHARFLRGDDADVVEDLMSTNGTFVNGERLNGTRPLRDGDLIAIGQTQLTYHAR
jgi:hypothetical protein